MRDTIKIDITEIGCEGGGWIELAEVRVQRLAFVNTVMKYRVQ
jgi:hypothetical protein